MANRVLPCQRCGELEMVDISVMHCIDLHRCKKHLEQEIDNYCSIACYAIIVILFIAAFPIGLIVAIVVVWSKSKAEKQIAEIDAEIASVP